MTYAGNANPGAVRAAAGAEERNQDGGKDTATDVAGQPFATWSVTDPKAIPARGWIYGGHYVRKFVSVTVAPGGIGKSTLVLAECIAMATGKAILGVRPRGRFRVVYHNAEDPLDEITRKVVAICQHHCIDQSDLVGWLFLASGRDRELLLMESDGKKINQGAYDKIAAFGRRLRIDVFVFDPLANMHDGPETNDVFRLITRALSLLADRLNCAVELVHHTRKLNGRDAEMDDGRGGNALVGAVRSGRTLNAMTPESAAAAGLETHVDHFRIDASGKQNLSRSSTKATWLKRVSISIGNGDEVVSLEPWDWPDAMEGLSRDDLMRIQARVAAADPPPRHSPLATHWVGNLLAEVLGLDTDQDAVKARLKALVNRLVKDKVLEVDRVQDTDKGREVPIVICGAMVADATGAA